MPKHPTRRAVVTGAGRGIGAEVVRRLAADGWSVVAVARNVDAAQAVFANLPDVRVERGDVTSVETLASVAASLGSDPLDLLVANAARFSPWDETASGADLDDVRDVLDVNVIGTWRTLQTFLPALRRAKSARVVVVGSGGGSHGDPQFGIGTNPGAAGYAAAKAAVHALVGKAALELAPEGIEVFAVDPGLTATAPGMAEMGARPVREGAESVLWPVQHPGSTASGSFTRDGQTLPW